MESRLFPRRVLPGCRADCFLPRRFRLPVPVVANRPIRNLSLAGISLIGLKPLPRGTVILLQIMGPRELPSFQVQGVVRWVDQRKNSKGRTITLTGIEFNPVDDKIRSHLDLLMEWKRRGVVDDARESVASGRFPGGILGTC